MSHTQAQENRQSADHIRMLVGLIVVLFCLTAATLTRDLLLSEPDLWWHIKTGEWMWQHGTVPTADPFSFTFAGQPWIAKEWLSQIIYFGGYGFTGWNGPATLGALAIGVGFVLLYWDVSACIKPSVAASATLVCVLLASSAFTVRPHLLTLPLLVIWTGALFGASLRGRAPNFLMLVVLLAWANLHAAFTMGLVIAVFAFLDFLENTRLTRKDELLKWLVFLVLCPLVTLIHPYGYRAMLATLWLFRPNDGGLQLIEWQPLNAQQDLIYVGALLGMVFGAIVSGFRLGVARALLVILLTYLFMKHLRYGFFLFPVLILVVAPAVARQFPRLSTEYWRSRPLEPIEQRLASIFKPAAATLAAGMVALLGFQLWVLRTAPPETVAATAAIDFAKSHGVSGNVMNQYNFGGPLVFNDIPTFIDGRTDQLFIGEFQKMVASELADAAGLARALDRYDISWTIMRPKDPETALLDKLPGWKRIYADDNAVIHQRAQNPSN